MLLGLNNVHRTLGAVLEFAVAFQVVNRNQGSDQAIQQTFRNFVAVFQQDSGVGHQVAYVTNEQQAAALQGNFAAVSTGVGAVAVHAAGHHLTAFLEGLFQVALHQAQPVFVGQNLVVGIYRSYGVFAVHDGGQG